MFLDMYEEHMHNLEVKEGQDVRRLLPSAARLGAVYSRLDDTCIVVAMHILQCFCCDISKRLVMSS